MLAAAAVVASSLLHCASSSSSNPGIDIDESHHQNLRSSATFDVSLDDARKGLIIDLPGLDYDPGFRQYSGYLTVSEEHGRNIFYWFIESENNPETDPVVLWTNGGPGCSGLIGLAREHGPYFIDQHLELSPNPYSWNKVANMLYIEQPAGVGFSYSTTPSDYKTGDHQAAADNYQVIRAFLERFPERQGNDFYISSESYGGHYMPQRKCLFSFDLKSNDDKLPSPPICCS
jgi:carboxypeptidase C (cathepsin A)